MRIEARKVFEACVLVVTLGCAPSAEDTLVGTDSVVARQSALTAASASTAPTVGPEFDLGQPLENSAAVTELSQAVATNESGVALVVWAVNGGDLYEQNLGTAVYGARVAADGKILDPAGIPIATTTPLAGTPAVASDGSGWFVTWAGQQYDSNQGIYAARVTSNGEVQAPTVISAPSSAYWQGFPAIAYGTTSFLVAWTRGSDIYVARVSTDATVLDPNGTFVVSLPRTMATEDSTRAGLAFDGTSWRVVWRANQGMFNGNGSIPWGIVQVASVDLSGEVGSIATIDSSRGFVDARPIVGCHAGSCLLVWEQLSELVGGEFSVRQLLGAIFGGDAGTTNAYIADWSAPRWADWPAVTWDGANWLVAWVNGLDQATSVNTERISSIGDRVGLPVALAPGAEHVAVAPTASGAFVAWGGQPLEAGTFASFLEDGNPTPSFVVSRELAHSPGWDAIAAGSRSDWLVIWDDLAGPTSESIRGTRVSPTGSILDPQGIKVSSSAYDVVSPLLASDGTNWLAVWGERHADTDWDVYGARVSADGALLDPEPKLIAGGERNQTALKVAFDGTRWLVVYNRESDGAFAVTRVDLDGTVLDPAGIVLGGSLRMSSVTLAGGNGQWLAAATACDQSYSNCSVSGQRIADDGSLLDAEPFTMAPLAGDLDAGDVVYGAGMWLVVAINRSDGTLYGTRVDASGAVLDTERIPVSGDGTVYYDGNRGTPSVAFDGTDWLVAWTDKRAWPPTSVVQSIFLPLDVYATRVSTAGSVLETDAFALAAGSGQNSLSVLAGGRGRWLSVYSKGDGIDVGLRARIIQNACTPLASTDTTCDGVDDDCDGTPDDDFVPTPTTCGAGTCATVGATSCVGGTLRDSCVPDPTDTDGDGVPNCSDACPLVPGTRGDGCPETGQGGAGGQGGEPHGGTGMGGVVNTGGVDTGGSTGSGGVIGAGGIAGTSGTGAGGVVSTGGVAGTSGAGTGGVVGGSGGVVGGNGGIAAAGSGNAGASGLAGHGGHTAGNGGAAAGHGGTSGTTGHAGTSGVGHGGTPAIAGEAGEGGSGEVPSAGTANGGSTAGRGGKAGATGNVSGQSGASSNPPPARGGGCGCSVPTQRSSAPWSLGLGLAVAVNALRRRRRNSERPSN
jgi:MYXO-CTERM domain-containing protein